MVFMISSMVAPFFRWSISITWPVLLPPRTPAGFGAGAAFLPLGAALAGVAFLTRLALHRRALRGLCATRGLLSGFRLRGRRLGLCGLGLGLRGLAQVLDAVPNLAGCRLAGLEAFHRVTPGRLLKVATKRPPANRRSVPPGLFRWRRNRKALWLQPRLPPGRRTR